MNLGSVIMGFIAIAFIATMMVFVSSTQSIEIVDYNGNTTDAVGNATNLMVTNVTSAGGAGVGGLVLVLAVLGVCAGVMMLYMYSKTR